MVMLNDHEWLNQCDREHNKKIADYLNQHPMFRDAQSGTI